MSATNTEASTSSQTQTQTTLTVEMMIERIKAWNFVKIPGACTTDNRFKTMMMDMLPELETTKVSLLGVDYYTILRCYARIIKEKPHRFTPDIKKVSLPDFIYDSDLSQNLMIMFRSLNASSTAFVYDIEKIKQIVMVATDKGQRISLPILIRLHPALQNAVLKQIDQLFPKPKVQQHHRAHNNSFMSNFNATLVSRQHDILKEELWREKIRRQCTPLHKRFYNRIFDSSVRGARINSKAEEIKALALMDKVVFRPETCIALMNTIEYGSIGNIAIEGVLSDLSFPNAKGKVHSSESIRVDATHDMEEIYNLHMNDHLNSNDHHPQYYEYNNLNIGVKATIEIMCDLLSCAIQQGAANVKEAIYIITKWVLKDDGTISHKYRKLNVFGLLIFSMRSEYLFDNSSQFVNVQKTRSWRQKLFHTEEFFINMYRSPFTPNWRKTSIKHYFNELNCHTHMVNTLLRQFGITAKHDNDKYEYRRMIAYTYHWGTIIKTEPQQTSDEEEKVETRTFTGSRFEGGIAQNPDILAAFVASMQQTNPNYGQSGASSTGAIPKKKPVEDLPPPKFDEPEFTGLLKEPSRAIYRGLNEMTEALGSNMSDANRTFNRTSNEAVLELKKTTEALLKQTATVQDETTKAMREALAAFLEVTKASQKAAEAAQQTATHTTQKLDNLEAKVSQAIDNLSNMNFIPEGICGISQTLLSTMVAPFKGFITKIATFIRSVFDEVYDIFAKILLPNRTRSILSNFTDNEIVEVIVLMFIFYQTQNLTFKIILASRLCIVIGIVDKVVSAYKYVKAYFSRTTQQQQPEGEPVVTADGDEKLPTSFFEVIVGMMTEPTPLTYAALLSTIAVCYCGVSAAKVNTRGFAQTAIQGLRNIGFASMGIAALPKLVELFSQGMNFLNTSFKRVKTGAKGTTAVELNTRVVKALLAAVSLEAEAMHLQITRCSKTRKFAVDTLKELDVLISMGENEVSYHPRYLSQLIQARRKLLPLTNLLNDKDRAASSRTVPVSIQFCGESQIGKSTITVDLANKIEKCLWPTHVPGSEIYARNNSDPYISNYNRQKIFIRDDVFAVCSDEEMTEWIGMKSSAPLYLNMAICEEKGLPFVSEFIITSTNTTYPQQNTVRHADAVYNRRDLLVKLELKEGWRKPINLAEYERHGLGVEDMAFYRHCTFTLVNPLAAGGSMEFAKEGDHWVPKLSTLGKKYDYEEFMEKTMSFALDYNKQKHAIKTSEQKRVTLEEALFVENLYHELRKKYPNMERRTFVAGVPHLTNDEFIDAYINDIVREGDDFNVEDFIDNVLKHDFNLGDEEEIEEEPAETSLGEDMISAIIGFCVSAGISTSYVRLIELLSGMNLAHYRMYYLKSNVYFFVAKCLVILFDHWANLERPTSEKTFMDNVYNSLRVEYGEVDTPEKRTAEEFERLVNGITLQQFKAILERHGLKTYRHPVATIGNNWTTLEMYPFLNNVNHNCVTYMNYLLSSKMYPDTPDRQLYHVLASNFYRDNSYLYSGKYNLNAVRPKLPTNLRNKMLRYFNYVDTTVPDNAPQRGCGVRFPSFATNGVSLLKIEDYDFSNLPTQEPLWNDKIKVRNMIWNFTSTGGLVLSLRVLQYLRPNTDENGYHFVIDLDDFVTDVTGRCVANMGNHLTPLRVWNLLKTQHKEAAAILLGTIKNLAMLTNAQLEGICNWIAEGVSPYLHTPQALRKAAREIITDAQNQDIPNSYNQTSLLLSSRLVGGTLLALLAIVVYKYIRFVFDFFFPPKETSKILLRQSKASHLQQNVIPTSDVVELCENNATFNVAKSMVKRAVRIKLHHETGSCDFNGHCFGQNVLTVAHPFLQGDRIKSEFLDIEIMTGNDIDSMQKFKIPTRAIIISTQNDCALLRIPEMRFFKNMSHKSFIREDDLLNCNYITENLFGHAFLKDGFNPISIHGARFVNKTKLVNSTTGLTLPNYIIFSGTMRVGTSGTLYYRIRPDSTVQVLGVQSCNHLYNSYIAPVTSEWIADAMNRLDQIWPSFDHEGPIVCCDEEPKSRITLHAGINFCGAVPRGATTSSMTQTKLRKTIIAEHYVTGEIPAILDPKDPLIPDGSHPLQHSANKWSALEMTPPEQRLIEIAITDVTNFYKGLLKNPKFRCDYTLEKVILGHGSPIALNTSAGLPWVLDRYKDKPIGKRAYININEFGEVDYIADELRSEFDRTEQCLKQRLIPPNSNYVFAKDELRPAKKAIGPPVKTRSISVMNQVFSLIYRKYNMDYETILAQHADGSNPYCVGMSPESPTGQNMYENMVAVGTFGFDLDVSHWDGHLPAWLLLGVTKHKCLMYGYKEHSPEWNVMYALTLNALFGFEQCEDLVYQKPAGMPSGFAGTAHDNTLSHIILFYIIWLMICEKNKQYHYANWQSFRALVCNYMYGDDVVVTASPLITDWFNARSVSEVYESLGWPTTTAKKGNEIVLLSPVHELQFLKRSWVPSSDIPGYHNMALNRETIARLCEWYRHSPDHRQQQRENFWTHLEFSFYHGPKFYNQALEKLNNALLEVCEQPISISYHQMADIIRSRYWDTYAGGNRNDYLFGPPQETSDFIPLEDLLGRATSEAIEVADTEELLQEDEEAAVRRERRNERIIQRLSRQTTQVLRTVQTLATNERGTDWFLVLSVILCTIAILLRLFRRR